MLVLVVSIPVNRASVSMGLGCQAAAYMGDCQSYGPFLGPYYNTGPNTGPNLGYPKRDHNFDNPPYGGFPKLGVPLGDPHNKDYSI